ncbi:exonuclease domain-containing protein [Candidatus Dojkabacteria bacterium]|nr:exonuclease domain-containing protein [Candidatus Dojkabacteria bacterium]
MSTNYIILDAEYTNWNNGTITSDFFPEVIQISAIKVNKADNLVIDRFTSYIRPIINPILSERIKSLCGISQSQIDKAPKLCEIYTELKLFIGESKVVSYGIDLYYINNNFTLYPCKEPLPVKSLDLNSLLAKEGFPVKKYRSGTLKYFYTKNEKKELHDAMDDVLSIHNFLSLIKQKKSFTNITKLIESD